MPAIRPEFSEQIHVALIDHIGVTEAFYGLFQTLLSDEMKCGKWSAVGEVAHVRFVFAFEHKIRMERCNLHHALQFMIGQHIVSHVQKVVEHQKIRKQRGVDQQRGVHLLGGCGFQQLQLSVQIIQKGIQMPGAADHQPHLVLDVHRLGERTQVQANDGPLQPAARLRQHFVIGHVHHFKALKRMRLGLAPSSPRRFFLSASYSW